jgi:hypothetical protein
MKLEFIGVSEIFNDTDEVILAKLLAAHQALRLIQLEMRNDIELQRAIKVVATLKEPYNRRILRNKSIVSSAELVARSRNIILTEDRAD